MEKKTYKIQVGARELVLEFGRLAGLANGSCVASIGESSVLGTAVMGEERPDLDFFPLMVNYQRRLSAAGMIKGSRFLKRDGRPSDDDILSQRVIDRGIRPLFPEGVKRDVQVMLTTLSFDRENDCDMIAANAASAAIAVSDLPWDGPTATVRVCIKVDPAHKDAWKENVEFIVNPTFSERKFSPLDLIVTSTSENILMVEAGANELSEKIMLDALDFAKTHTTAIAREIQKIASEIGKEKVVIAAPEYSPEIRAMVEAESDAIRAALQGKDKKTVNNSLAAIKSNLKEKLADESHPQHASAGQLGDIWSKVQKSIIRSEVLDQDLRVYGRKPTEIRQLSVEVDVLPRVHGVGLFQRGETQALTVATLGTPKDGQLVEDLNGEHTKRYIHYYEFPPYATGETSGRLMANNRAIGHGALAERALLPVLPSEEDCPYTILVVSNIVACNGSSSMASVCGSSLSLMDAGIKIKAPVAGIAMGMISDEASGKYKILSDIAGIEDASGDMDFKVTGTVDGITALQLDVKINGLSREIFEEAFAQAREGRLSILKAMTDVIAEPRADLKPYAPRITTIKIKPEQIGAVIGKGGETIQRIQSETGAAIDIKGDDSGVIFVAADNAEGARKAIEMIEQITYEPQIGDVLDGKVVKCMDFGAFVEIAPGKEGLVHISELADHHVANTEDEVKAGDIIKVRVIKIDKFSGKIGLSKKSAEAN